MTETTKLRPTEDTFVNIVADAINEFIAIEAPSGCGLEKAVQTIAEVSSMLSAIMIGNITKQFGNEPFAAALILRHLSGTFDRDCHNAALKILARDPMP